MKKGAKERPFKTFATKHYSGNDLRYSIVAAMSFSFLNPEKDIFVPLM